MSMSLPSWMPPTAGSEADHLLGALNRMRATFRWKADGLDAAGLSQRTDTSELTIGGLLMHLARVEDEASSARLNDSATDPYFDAFEGEGDPEFAAAADMAPDEIYGAYDRAVVVSQQRFAAAIAEGGLDALTALQGPFGEMASLRRLLFDLLEEYGRHCGHADLLREAIDGRVGEDPPISWAPFDDAETA